MDDDLAKFKRAQKTKVKEHDELHGKFKPMEKCDHGDNNEQLEGGDRVSDFDTKSQFTNHRMETWKNVKFTKNVVDENGDVRSIVYKADKTTPN